jgi:hypothetical protein
MRDELLYLPNKKMQSISRERSENAHGKSEDNGKLSGIEPLGTP